ncbi:MAG: hypothetical protein IJZ79_03465 [Bacilli bacterium]|nr:hypothetical protein [Bacilli bacterium]MBQ8218787.1 hypothetical protein [Bacilli bacterium]
MNISDVYLVCTITFTYDYNLNQSEILFRDIITNSPIIIPQVVLMELNNYVKSYMDQTNELPSTACLFGQFARNSQYIYALEIDSMQIMNVKLVNCYLEQSNLGIIRLIDEVTCIPIQVITANKEESESLYKFIETAYRKTNANFTKDGDDRFTCIGFSVIEHNNIIYDSTKMFYLDTPENVAYNLYMQFINNQ